MRALTTIFLALLMVLLFAPTGHTGTACTIEGTPDDEIIHGTSEPDVICGMGGSDEILARQGADIVYGGRGDDVILGKSGKDRLFGQEGWDYIQGDGGRDLQSGQNGTDCLTSIDGFRGDVLRGGAGNKDHYHAERGDIVRNAEVNSPFACPQRPTP